MAEKIKNKGGRPVGSGKYTDDFISDIALKLDKWIQEPDKFWLGSFAAENGFGRQRLSDFAAKSQLFAEIYEKAKQVQENKLFMLGLSNKGNATMVIFALKNVAGWRDAKPEEQDGDLINQELSFDDVPLNGDGTHRFAKFIQQ
jgi:hypothetical protein